MVILLSNKIKQTNRDYAKKLEEFLTSHFRFGWTKMFLRKIFLALERDSTEGVYTTLSVEKKYMPFLSQVKDEIEQFCVVSEGLTNINSVTQIIYPGKCFMLVVKAGQYCGGEWLPCESHDDPVYTFWLYPIGNMEYSDVVVIDFPAVVRDSITYAPREIDITSVSNIDAGIS